MVVSSRGWRWGLVVGGLLAAAVAGEAQSVGPEQNPPGIRWRVVESPRARIFTPVELEAEAQRVAARLERIAALDTATLAGTPERLQLVLQPRYMVPNGFVALLPRRSEWFLPTLQGDNLQGGVDWYDLLAVHEYRHVKQVDALNAGLTRRLSRVFGEFPRAVAQLWTIPAWFMEGDAVATETALTGSGRGRTPAFDADLRARLLDDPIPSYQTLQHRSFASQWPDHYVHGYTLVAEARRRFGPSVWDRALRGSTQRIYNPNALSAALRKQTGTSIPSLHRDALRELQTAVRAQAAALTPTPTTVAGGAPRDWLDDRWPQWGPDGSLLVMQRGIDVLPSFVSLTPGSDRRRVLQPVGPYIPAPPPSVGGHILAWIEARFDPRWQVQSWAVVMQRDLRTGTTRQVGDTTRWMAVAMAPDGARMALVEQQLDRRMALLFADADGRVQGRVQGEVGDAFSSPRWSGDGRGVLVMRIRRNAGRRIDWCPAPGGSCRPLTAFTEQALNAPAGDSALVFATAPYNGREEIVAIRPADGTWARVTERPIGASDPSPSPDGRLLAFNDVTSKGRRAVTMPIDPATWRPYALPATDTGVVAVLTAQTGGVRPLADTVHPTYPVHDYRPVSHLWNPYGVLVSAPPLSPNVGVSVASQNILGTFASSVGAEYNLNERQPGARLGVSYGGWYPIIDADIAVTQRSDRFDAVGSLEAGEWTWRESSAGLGVRLPLLLTNSVYNRALSLQASLRQTRVTNSTLPAPYQSDNGTVRPLRVAADFQRAYQTVRDIWPVQGQLLSASAITTPVGGAFTGRQLFARGRVFVPGALRHHGVQLDAAVEAQTKRASLAEAAPYRFASNLPFARGYESVSAPVYRRLSASYAAPLWYPDVALGGTVQVRRLRATAFGDWMEATTRVRVSPGARQLRDATARYRSAGVELWADTRWWNLPVDLPIGVRWSRLFDGPDAGRGRVQAVLSFGAF